MIKLLERGSKIDQIRLVSDEGFIVDLPDPNGYTLLWWDPRKMAQACMDCAKQTRPFIDGLRGRGIRVYGVTFDQPSKNAELSLFAFDNHLRILTADIETAIAFGTYRGENSMWNRYPHRAAFLINSKGVVEKTWLIQHIPSFREDLLRYLSEQGTESQIEQPSLFKRILDKVM